MKHNVIRLVALIAGSILSIPVIGIVLLMVAYDGKLEFSEPHVFLTILALTLYVIGAVIAWFKIKLGGILITVCAIAQIILFHESNEPFLTIIQILIVPIGPLLLFYSYSIKQVSKKG